MNPFDLTPEQERHWQIQQDASLFEREYQRDTPDPKYKIAHISNETQKRLHYLRIKKKKERKFYSLGGTANSLTVSGQDADTSGNKFVTEVEDATFDDSELVRTLISMQKNLLPLEPKPRERSLSSLQQGGEIFINGVIKTTLGYGDSQDKLLEEHSGLLVLFLKFLEALKPRLEFHKDTLMKHPLFEDIEKIIEQVGYIHTICRDARLNASDSGHIIAELPEEFSSFFPEEAHTSDSKTRNIYQAKALLLHSLGLVPHIKYLFTLGSLLDYIERSAKTDSTIVGVYPEIVDPSDDGLVLDVKNFAHPAIYRGKSIAGYCKDLCTNLPGDIFTKLESDGLVSVEKRSNSYYWNQNVTTEMIERFIRKHDLEPGPAETLLTIYQRSNFFPFEGIHLNARNRIQIVTGANFNGKSTYMQSIGYLFHRAATTRKMIATSATLSMPDMVFDDFDINSNRQRDISRERSTFSSQVNKIVEFMDNATTKSIGLFDELYHGTSAPYLLSLGWATIEEFERLGLYAIISTHEPLLTRFTERNGYESLRGKYYRPSYSASSERETSVRNVSLQENYRLRCEPVTDSDAFRIARQEKMKETVMSRAQKILCHITQNPNA